ncbi:MAG: DMT family transporter [Desulfobacteraceae bacterium]|nr:DMT family transporter [Desulfobacteraceae bacterium]
MLKFKFLTQNPSLTGIILIISGGFIFSIQDVIIKYISGSYPVHEIVFLRSLFAILPIYAIVRMEGGLHLLRMHNMKYHIIRGVLMFFSYTAYYLAIAAIPLSLAVTLFFCCPLFITVLSVIFLKEKMDAKGWAALFSGFVGVLVIMGPDLAVTGRAGLLTNHYGPFLAVLSGFFYAVNAVCTRKFGIHESGSSLVFYPILTYLLFGGLLWMTMGDGRFATEGNRNLAFLLRAWTLPGNRDLFLLLVLGCVAAGGTYCLSQAYRITNASVAAPFEYFAIPISVIWGYLFWEEVPKGAQIIGILMVVAGGIYVLNRKRNQG